MTEKEWSKEEVAIAHNYGVVSETHHLDKFVSYCNSANDTSSKLRILDLGCGNGRVAISLNKHLNKDFYYLGLDINKKAIDVGRSCLLPRSGSEIELIVFDVDLSTWPNNSFDICLIDSTLHMFDNPSGVLYKCDKCCDTIYVTRNKLEIQSGLEKRFFRWGGMNHDSPYWLFSKEFFDNFSTKTNRNVVYEIGPTPETYNIIMKKR